MTGFLALVFSIPTLHTVGRNRHLLNKSLLPKRCADKGYESFEDGFEEINSAPQITFPALLFAP
jgi:hypothetical protein